MRAAALCLWAASALPVSAGEGIPAPKLERIRAAVTAMKIDRRVESLVAQRVEARAREVRAANPGLPDSVMAAVRAVIASVHEGNLEGPDGLMPRVYAVLDRRLSEEDLRFAARFQGSDQGRRYRELAPRIAQECLEAGREWADRLEPETRRRLEEAFRGTGLRF